MKLTVQNFFARLIFHPFEADTKIDRMIALVASIACGVFSIGLCHAICAIRRCFTHRPSSEATQQDLKMAKVKESVLNSPKPSSKGQTQLEIESSLTLPKPATETQEIKKDQKIQREPLTSKDFQGMHLSPSKIDRTADEQKLKVEAKKDSKSKVFTDLLFEGTQYSFESLPIYDMAYGGIGLSVLERKMTHPVMKATYRDDVLILIKVEELILDKNTGTEKPMFHPSGKTDVLIFINQHLKFNRGRGWLDMRGRFLPFDPFSDTPASEKALQAVQKLLREGWTCDISNKYLGFPDSKSLIN